LAQTSPGFSKRIVSRREAGALLVLWREVGLFN